MYRTLEWLLFNACDNDDYAKIWTMQASCGHHVFAHDGNRVSHCTVLILYTMFCLKCIWVPGMCPEPRWIDYPAPRSPADSFAMAGPIRHCLLRACNNNNNFIYTPDSEVKLFSIVLTITITYSNSTRNHANHACCILSPTTWMRKRGSRVMQFILCILCRQQDRNYRIMTPRLKVIALISPRTYLVSRNCVMTRAHYTIITRHLLLW